MNAPAAAGPRLPANSTLVSPIIVIGELLYGAYNSRRVSENLQRIDTLSKMARIIAMDWGTAVQFGHIRQQLISKGRTIPDDDMWIAAIALQHNQPVVTRDKHFADVGGLQIIPW
jgi:tRNA(fMet)-specific endonuclease VapC